MIDRRGCAIEPSSGRYDCTKKTERGDKVIGGNAAALSRIPRPRTRNKMIIDERSFPTRLRIHDGEGSR